MIDANVLVSAALFPNSITAQALAAAVKKHELLVCTFVLDEVRSVFERKFPEKTASLEAYISKLAYEHCDTPDVSESTPEMRDNDDRPILQAAINSKADAILTGDKDFHALKIKLPRIMSPNDMLK
jgi:putative PIN family toxin of toxin-antitoxin system